MCILVSVSTYTQLILLILLLCCDLAFSKSGLGFRVQGHCPDPETCICSPEKSTPRGPCHEARDTHVPQLQVLDSGSLFYSISTGRFLHALSKKTPERKAVKLCHRKPIDLSPKPQYDPETLNPSWRIRTLSK